MGDYRNAMPSWLGSELRVAHSRFYRKGCCKGKLYFVIPTINLHLFSSQMKDLTTQLHFKLNYLGINNSENKKGRRCCFSY